MSTALIALLAALLIVVIAVRLSYRHLEPAEETVELVSPPPYIGPKTFTCNAYSGRPYGKAMPYLDGVPKAHLNWAKLLLGETNLDDGAGYFHNVGHESLVLHTRLTPQEIVDAIEDITGLQGEAHENGHKPNVYRWVEFDIGFKRAQELDVYPYDRFHIEVRRLHPRTPVFS